MTRCSSSDFWPTPCCRRPTSCFTSERAPSFPNSTLVLTVCFALGLRTSPSVMTKLSISSSRGTLHRCSTEPTRDGERMARGRARECSASRMSCLVSCCFLTIGLELNCYLSTATHPRIQSLRNPLEKMSKSAPHPSSKIFLTDSPSQIHAKIKSAVTDSIQGVTWDPSNRPGVAALLQIYSGYSGEEVESIAQKFEGTRGIMEMKESLAEVVESGLRSFRGEFERIRMETGYLEEREREGARRAREAAQETMKEVKAAVGTD